MIPHPSNRFMSFIRRITPASTELILRLLGLAGCAVCGLLPVMMALMVGPQSALPGEMFVNTLAKLIAAERVQMAFWLFLALYSVVILIFTACFWVRTSPWIKRSALIDAGLFILQIVLALASNHELLFIVAVEFALLLPQRQAVFWMGAQIGLFVASAVPWVIAADGIGMVWNVPGIALPSMMTGKILETGWLTTWQLFAFCGGCVAIAQQRSRVQVAVAHAERMATQQLLADAIRGGERVRIARNLHDAIGHHLTALNLHLDLAVRQSGSRIIPALQAARELAHRMLAEVRAVVSIERRDQAIHLRQALETLCAGMPFPHIALSFGAKIEITAPALAHTLFRCVQEVIGNTVNHTGAGPLRIGVSSEADCLVLLINGDRKTRHAIEQGEGLCAMRERIAELGGHMEFFGLAEGGFDLRIGLPQAGGLQ